LAACAPPPNAGTADLERATALPQNTCRKRACRYRTGSIGINLRCNLDDEELAIRFAAAVEAISRHPRDAKSRCSFRVRCAHRHLFDAHRGRKPTRSSGPGGGRAFLPFATQDRSVVYARASTTGHHRQLGRPVDHPLNMLATSLSADC